MTCYALLLTSSASSDRKLRARYPLELGSASFFPPPLIRTMSRPALD
jgi:hypothetical protein